eukprot:TRINITY_DN990_c0_g1_i3.p1 TRINITY_DN990_c0_g1~~TRINITY_DN990_c0_g1_i3.p1  ORF type:complete len:355 (+),score=122.45 TRINITY_DN990_c0_g1_i3:163-1227(+)
MSLDIEFDIPSWGNDNNESISSIDNSIQKKRKRNEEDVKKKIGNQTTKQNNKLDSINSNLQKKKMRKEEKKEEVTTKQVQSSNQKKEGKEKKLESNERKKEEKKEEKKYETMKEKLKQKIEEQRNQKKLSPLQEKMKERLAGGQFRWLNEQLYTTTGSQSFQTFQKDPSLFNIYHSGFQMQVDKWPVNPLDELIRFVSSLPSSKVIADFGCGEARLAQSVSHKVHSFDLHSPNPHVVACDISHVPLDDESVDVVIFCLSLMGTNYLDFIKEAKRVLKPRGIIKIAEVKSRISEETEIKKFTNQIKQLGFKLSSTDKSNKMFISFQFNKVNDQINPPKSDTKESSVLKPCIYKRR